MASILRQIVAGPRLQHPETGLDLCYVADNIIATSGPSTNYPKIAYRTPLKQLVSFLDDKHGEDWCIWEFRAEGTGYPDSEVYGRIHHFPFPDHHPPPFALIPKVMASMRNWLQRLDGSETGSETGQEGDKDEKGKRIAVVHCKAGKGRSGSMACSYLISQEGWKMEDALQRFTERRMRVGFGSGVSIPSQLRWVRYVNRWTNEMGKKYFERPVEILEIHVWGLRDGVKVAVEGFVEDGQKIKQFHLFHRNERVVMQGDASQSQSASATGSSDEGNASSSSNINLAKAKPEPKRTTTTTNQTTISSPQNAETATESDSSLLPPSNTLPNKAKTMPTSTPTNTTTATPTTEPTPSKDPSTKAVLLRPSKPLLVPSPDINIDFERRSKAASYTGLPMVTSIAHVWFNPYFEGGDTFESGVFSVDWEAMDGIKGTSKKGIKALDRLKVVWRYAEPSTTSVKDADENSRPVSRGVVMEPKPGEEIPEVRVRDWRLKEGGEGTGSDNEAEERGLKGDSSADEGEDGKKENVPLTSEESKKEGEKKDKDETKDKA